MPLENGGGDMRPRRGTPPIQAILPKEPLRKMLSAISTTSSKNGDPTTAKCVDIPTDAADNSENSKTTNPYDVVSKKPPVFECSGNSENSGNSIYAKVKDVQRREETAYAVVDIGQDKDYDFVNGEVIRRTPDASASSNNPPVFMHYDKPKSQHTEIKISEETENSGASGIYEFVPESRNNKENFEPLSVDVQLYNISNNSNNTNNNNDLYDFCGPATPRSQTPSAAAAAGDTTSAVRLNSSCDVTDRTTTTTTTTTPEMHSNSLDRKTNNLKQKENPRRSSSKEALGDFKEESRLSRYLKFTQSKKHKKHSDETIEVDIPSPYSSSKDISVASNSGNTLEVCGGGGGDDKAPPAPSIKKLKQLSAHRKEYQGTLNEKSHSPGKFLV